MGFIPTLIIELFAFLLGDSKSKSRLKIRLTIMSLLGMFFFASAVVIYVSSKHSDEMLIGWLLFFLYLLFFGWRIVLDIIAYPEAEDAVKEQSINEEENLVKKSRCDELLNEVGNAFFVRHYELLKTKSNALDIFDITNEAEKNLNYQLTIQRINSGLAIFKERLNVIALERIIAQDGVEKETCREAAKFLNAENEYEIIKNNGAKKEKKPVSSSSNDAKKDNAVNRKRSVPMFYIPTPDYFDIKCPCCNNELSIDRNLEYTDKFSCPYCNTNINLGDYN